MENQCLTPQIVYRADFSNNKDNETKFYYGLKETSFKETYGNHKRSFRHERYENDTETQNTKSDFCKLCLTEKYLILNDLGKNKLLNKKSEFVNKCCHQNKLFLSSVLCKDIMD